MRASIARRLRLVKRGCVAAQSAIHRLTVAKAPERVRGTMRKLLPFLLCVLLSIFTVARATRTAQTDANPSLKNATTEEEVTSDDDDSMEDPSGDEGEDMNDDDGSGVAGDEDTGADDAEDDNGGDDSSNNDGP
jgi:hypothetical protein